MVENRFPEPFIVVDKIPPRSLSDNQDHQQQQALFKSWWSTTLRLDWQAWRLYQKLKAIKLIRITCLANTEEHL